MTESMMLLVLQLGVIIFATQIIGRLFERMSIPAIVGEVVAGIIIGPYLLGSITIPWLKGPLFPMHGDFPISPELYGIATIASIVLLFLVGLETNLEMFIKYSLAGFSVGLGGVIVSFILGDLTGVVFSKYIFGEHFGFMHPLCMFLGAISTATSVGITARILSDRKKMQSPEGVTIVSGAVIDDILGIIVLAIIVAIVKSSHIQWSKIAAIGFKSIIIWLVFTAVGLATSRYISNFLKIFKDTVSIAIISFGMALLLSGIFEEMGLAMIIGAYVMGLSLSRTDLNYAIQEKLAPLHKFLVPIFFCVMGMMVNLFAMANRAALLFGLAYTIICIFGKIIGCGLPPLALNFNLRGAMRIGLGMIPRGEVALLITAIGLAAGILNQDVLGSVVFMTMATTLITPSVLSLSLRSSKPVLRKAIETKETRKHITFDMPNTETTDLLLGKIISALHGDGFYIHRTDTGEDISRLYHLQKDQTSIGMQKFSTKIEFDCKEQESVFVHTLVYEVLFDVENTIKQLQALTDIESIGKKIFDKANGKVLQKKDFTKYILPSGVDVDLKGNTKQDIIKEMIGLLVKSGQLRDEDKDAVFGEVMKREEIMSTGMQDGIAIPHAKTDAVKQVVCAAALKKGGVDFKSLDGKPSYIFILILSPKDITGPHIRFMADISQLLLDEERRQRLVSSRTKEELYRAITLT